MLKLLVTFQHCLVNAVVVETFKKLDDKVNKALKFNSEIILQLMRL